MEKPQLHPIYGPWAKVGMPLWVQWALGAALVIAAACLFYFLCKKWRKKTLPILSPQAVCLQELQNLCTAVGILPAADFLKKIDTHLHNYLSATQPGLSPGWTLDDLPKAVSAQTREVIEPVLQNIEAYRFSAATPDLATRQELLARAIEFIKNNHTPQPL